MTFIYNKQDHTYLRKKLRNQSTPAEDKLWYYLRSQKLGVRFRRQYGIGKYIVDFYVPSHRLVIELDGPIHLSREAREYDAERQRDIEALGINVIRFTNDRILCNIDSVIRDIRTALVNMRPIECAPPPLTPPS